MPQQLANAPGCPPLAAHVWGWFAELHAERGDGMKLNSKTIRDWSDAIGARVADWERLALIAIDRIWTAPRA